MRVCVCFSCLSKATLQVKVAAEGSGDGGQVTIDIH